MKCAKCGRKMTSIVTSRFSYDGSDYEDTLGIEEHGDYNAVKIIEKDIAKAKSEAIKEFAERLKEETLTTDKFGEILLVQDIDNLVKEMVGDDNA